MSRQVLILDGAKQEFRNVRWLRILKFFAGATIKRRDGDTAQEIVALAGYVADPSDPRRQFDDTITIGGTCIIDVEESANGEAYPGPPTAQSALVVATGGAIAGSIALINEAVTIALSGGLWATAKATFGATASGIALATEVSSDGGVNWIPSPLAKDVTTVAANPAFLASGTGAVGYSSKAWEVPLPANATHFRVRATAALGSALSVTLAGGTPYVAGVPIVATLADLTSAVNTAIDTGVLELNGWTSELANFTTSGVASTLAQAVRIGSNGAANGGANIAVAITTTQNLEVTYGQGVANTTTSTNVSQIGGGAMPRRGQYLLAATVAQTGRVIVEVRR